MPAIKIDWTKINRPDRVFQRFPSRRSQVYSSKGIVACSQPLAAQAGLEILRKGGNAGMFYFFASTASLSNGGPADAAVATSAALNVTEPTSCGIGGLVLGSIANKVIN